MSFGSSATGLFTLGGTQIDLTATPGLATNHAFVMPRAGTLTQLSATFANTIALSLGGQLFVNAQIFRSQAPNSNIFTPYGPAVVFPLPGNLALGFTQNVTVAIPNLPVNVGDRLILVFYLTTAGITAIAEVTGYLSAGLAIA